MLKQDGRVSTGQKAALFDAGYTQQHALAVILGVTQKMISNFAAHHTETPLDEVLKRFA